MLYRDATSGHWYEYLFNQMGTNLEDFRNSQLSVITFNHDRSLEHFLFLALRHSYGLSDEESSKHLKAIPIVHVYGTLGGSIHFEEHSRTYNDEFTPSIAELCASAIKVLHEGTTDDPELAVVEAVRVLRPGGQMMIVDFAPHNVEELRRNHAHHRLGFPTGEVKSWFENSELKFLHAQNMKGDPLTVSLWLAEKTTVVSNRSSASAIRRSPDTAESKHDTR